MEWLPPSGPQALSGDAVDVWRVALDDPLPLAAAHTLSGDELERAGARRFPEDARRFVAGRAALRAILSRYAGADPASLVFTYSGLGKPSLVSAGTPAARLTFNVSHSAGLALCAVALGRDIGVDVEWTGGRARFDAMEGYFSPAECDELRRLDSAVLTRARYVCWTRKEAFLKARGDGVSVPLDAFDMSCTPGERPRIVAVRPPFADGRHWTVLDVKPAEDFEAAAVVEGAEAAPRLWRWVWPG